MSESANAVQQIPHPVRPMMFGEILDRIFQLLRRNFWLLIGIAGVPSAAFIALYGLMMAVMIPTIGVHPQTPPDPGVLLPMLGIIELLLFAVMVVVYPLYAAAGSHAAISAAEGRKVTVRAAYGVAWQRAGSYIWLYVLRILYFLAPIVLICVLIGVGIFLTSRGGGASVAGILLIVLAVLGYLGVTVFAILMMLRWALAYPASVVEGLTASATLKRSSQLTKGAKGRIFLVALVIYAFAFVLEFALMIVFEVVGVIGALVGKAQHISLESPAGFIPVGLFAACGLFALFFFMATMWASYSVSFSVLYLDQRVRLEGYDIERMMQAAGMEQAESGGAPA